MHNAINIQIHSDTHNAINIQIQMCGFAKYWPGGREGREAAAVTQQQQRGERWRLREAGGQGVIKPIHSLPQGCVWRIRCNHAIIHCNWIGDWYR